MAVLRVGRRFSIHRARDGTVVSNGGIQYKA